MRIAKVQASLHVHALSPNPMQFIYLKVGQAETGVQKLDMWPRYGPGMRT